MAAARISTRISQETKERLERYAVAHGMKKGALVEQALLHYFQALRDMPAITPSRLELNNHTCSGMLPHRSR